MSVSPTKDALVVALDFDGEIECIAPSSFRKAQISQMIGVHRLDRSTQEDTLLVLFNTAISNFVSKRLHIRYFIFDIL